MRSGRLLTEDSPENLLQKYALFSLEDVFLRLCTQDFSNSQAETVSNAETVGEIAFAVQQLSAGIDNDAFERSASQLDVSGTPIPPICVSVRTLFSHPLTNCKENGSILIFFMNTESSA